MTPKYLKQPQKWYPYDHPVRNNGSFKFWKNSPIFFLKNKKFQIMILTLLKTQAKGFYSWKVQAKLIIYRKIAGCQTCYFVSPNFCTGQSNEAQFKIGIMLKIKLGQATLEWSWTWRFEVSVLISFLQNFKVGKIKVPLAFSLTSIV